jgi:hypothetical protein
MCAVVEPVPVLSGLINSGDGVQCLKRALKTYGHLRGEQEAEKIRVGS